MVANERNNRWKSQGLVRAPKGARRTKARLKDKERYDIEKNLKAPGEKIDYSNEGERLPTKRVKRKRLGFLDSFFSPRKVHSTRVDLVVNKRWPTNRYNSRAQEDAFSEERSLEDVGEDAFAAHREYSPDKQRNPDEADRPAPIISLPGKCRFPAPYTHGASVRRSGAKALWRQNDLGG